MGAVEQLEVADEPIFTSAHSALKFAFNFSHGWVKRRPLYALAGGAAPAGKGLGGLDGAAQAGMILAELTNLSAVRQRIIEARFAPRTMPCACRAPCCSGSRDTARWADATAWLVEYVLVEGLTATISHYRLRRAVVARYFGARESFVDIASVCGVNRDTASDLCKRVTERFRAEERPAMFEIEGRLKKARIVES